MKPRIFLAAAAVLALLVCYAPILAGMAQQWSTDEDMGHGFLVPVVAGWIVWRERAKWMALPITPSLWGVAVLAIGAGLHVGSALGAGLFAGALGLLVSMAGVTLAIGGAALVRAWAFPLALCVFMLPKLAVVYNQVTLPMQLLASRLAATLLTLSGAAVIREGNILELGGHQILVAEACSGIRYLLPLAFLGVTFAYQADSKPWMRVALLLFAIPLSIAANAARVALVGRFPFLAGDTPHAVAGWVIFVLCLGGLLLARRVIHRMAAHA